jgi:hypothetical protein
MERMEEAGQPRLEPQMPLGASNHCPLLVRVFSE